MIRAASSPPQSNEPPQPPPLVFAVCFMLCMFVLFCFVLSPGACLCGQVLRLVARVHAVGRQHGNVAVQTRAASEVREMVSTMRCLGLFEASDATAGRELWELTLAIVEPFCPGFGASFQHQAEAAADDTQAPVPPEAAGTGTSPDLPLVAQPTADGSAGAQEHNASTSTAAPVEP